MKNIFQSMTSLFGGSKIIVGSGISASKTILLDPNVNALINDSIIDVEVRFGELPQAEIIADNNLIDLIVVKQEGGGILVGIKDNTGFSSNTTMKVIVSLPHSLKFISAKSVGSIKTFDESCKSVELIESEGVGSVKIDYVQSIKLSVIARSIGSVTLQKGEIASASLTSKGVGNINADSVVCKNATVCASSVGNVKLSVTDSLDAHASGIGNIKYSGNPIKVNKNATGIGKIKQK